MPSRPPGRPSRSPAARRSAASPSSSARSTSSPPRRSLRPTACTGAGRSRARRSTSRSVRRGRPLHEVVGRDPQPVRFVNSMRLGDPATIDPVRGRLELYPWLEFKLDATSSWTDELVAELAATGAVESVDLKGLYSGTSVDQGPDAALYRRVAEGFPNAWIEDPALTPETEEVLAKHWDRVTWDEPIHSIADLEALPHPPEASTSSRRGSAASPACSQPTSTARRRGSGPTAAASSSSVPAAARSSTSPPCSTPPRRTTSRRVRSTSASSGPGLPQSPLEPAPSETGFRWNWPSRPVRGTQSPSRWG